MAETIRRGVEALGIPHSCSRVAGHVTVSLGVVTLPCTKEAVLQQATTACDKLLFKAKESVRNRVVGKDSAAR